MAITPRPAAYSSPVTTPRPAASFRSSRIGLGLVLILILGLGGLLLLNQQTTPSVAFNQPTYNTLSNSVYSTSPPTPEITASPVPLPTMPFVTPAHDWFIPYIIKTTAWLRPDVKITSVGELVLIWNYAGDLVVCASTAYTSPKGDGTGALGTLFWIGSDGTLNYNAAGAQTAGPYGVYLSSLADCQKGVTGYNSVIVTVNP